MGDQDKSWAPHFCSVTCVRRLAAWAKSSRCMPFAIPMVWTEPTDHVLDCYFCLTSITGVTANSKHTVQYPNLPSTMGPVPDSVELPVPKPPTNMTLSDSESNDEDVGQANNNMDCDPTFTGANSSNEPHLLTQGGLKDIVRDLNPSKKQAELLVSGLKDWNLLREDTKVCFTWAPWRIQGFLLPGRWCMIFVPLWKFLAMTLSQISCACSMICQKWAWRWFYSTAEIDSPPFLRLMQPTWRKIVKAWIYCWERLSMMNWSASYVVISRLWNCYSECTLSTQNTAVSCSSGTRRITM